MTSGIYLQGPNKVLVNDFDSIYEGDMFSVESAEQDLVDGIAVLFELHPNFNDPELALAAYDVERGFKKKRRSDVVAMNFCVSCFSREGKDDFFVAYVGTEGKEEAQADIEKGVDVLVPEDEQQKFVTHFGFSFNWPSKSFYAENYNEGAIIALYGLLNNEYFADTVSELLKCAFEAGRNSVERTPADS